MITPTIILIGLSILFTLVEIIYKNQRVNLKKYGEIFLSNILFFILGLGSLMGTYVHIFDSVRTAELIGWSPNPFFQFELGMANLAFGTLGILCRWIRGQFWEATIISWSVFVLGCFAGHIISYYTTGDISPLNFGSYIWLNDLFIPIFTIGLLIFARTKKR
jgi:hypothetical protein